MFDSLPDTPRAPIKPCLNILSGLLSMSVDLRFQEPWWVTCPSGSAHSWVSPVLPFLPAPPCVPDASVLGAAPSLDPGSVFPPLRSVFHLLTRISISQTRLRRDFDFKVGIRFPTELLQMLQAPARPALRETLPFSARSQLEPGKPALCPTL